MAAKEIIFSSGARERDRQGPQPARQRGEGHARTARPQRRDREVVGRADGDQGRRHRRQGDRAREQVPEHGRADGEGGRVEDLRRRRRRHHHRDRARPGDLQRGRQAGRRRAQPDGPQARHRGRRSRSVVEQIKAMVDPDQGQGGHRPGRHDQRQRRHRDRRDDRRGDEEGRQGRRDHGRGGQDADLRARRGRGHAVRPRLPVGVLRDRLASGWRRCSTTRTS